MGQHFENESTFPKWVNILKMKMGQHFENESTFWKWVNILKMGQYFENWNANHFPHKMFQKNCVSFTNDVCAWNVRTYAWLSRGRASMLSTLRHKHRTHEVAEILNGSRLSELAASNWLRRTPWMICCWTKCLLSETWTGSSEISVGGWRNSCSNVPMFQCSLL